MHEYASLNGEILAAADAAVPALSPAALYGKGVFTTVAIYAGSPFLWEKHWRRLTSNAEKLGIHMHPESTVRDSLHALITQNAANESRARVTIFDESPGPMWLFGSKRRSSLLITTAERREMPHEFRLTASPYRIDASAPLSGIKSCNYLEKLAAVDEARRSGFDEAIRLNQRGHIAAACMANIFWLTDGKLCTPGLNAGCLPGTTREFVIENLDVEEVEAGWEAIGSADAVFLTSAGLGVIEASCIEHNDLPKSGHPILDLLPPTSRHHA